MVDSVREWELRQRLESALAEIDRLQAVLRVKSGWTPGCGGAISHKTIDFWRRKDDFKSDH